MNKQYQAEIIKLAQHMGIEPSEIVPNLLVLVNILCISGDLPIKSHNEIMDNTKELYSKMLLDYKTSNKDDSNAIFH